MTPIAWPPGGRLVLGGVEIETSSGSTATQTPTCSTHALIDALLGAAGLGDIGEHFPDTEERWRDADSMPCWRASWRGSPTPVLIVNVDCTVIVHGAPSSGRTRPAIRARLASALGLSRPRA